MYEELDKELTSERTSPKVSAWIDRLPGAYDAAIETNGRAGGYIRL